MWQKIKRRLFLSKTYVFNHLLAIVGILELHLHLIQNKLGENYGVVFIAVAVAGYILRELTKTPVDAK